NVMFKLHKACVNLYNTQLPLKPLERDLKLSRQTMRNEIEYHSMFIPKKPIITQPSPLVIPPPESQMPIEDKKQEIEESNEVVEDKIENINFIFEDENLLDDIAGYIKDFVVEKVECNNLVEESTNYSLTQLMNMAKDEEAKYNYKYAELLYQNALTKNKDDYFDKFLPTIYLKLAHIYKKTSKWYEALEYLTNAQDYYVNVSDNVKVAEVKLMMANIYFIIYKQDNARYILNELENEADLPNELKIRIYIMSGKICENINEEYTYYNKPIALDEYTNERKLKAELYYRFASVNDQKDNTKEALTYYKKCIDVEPDFNKNKYLSRALASIADLLDESGNTEAAVKYYLQSMKIDTQTENYNGLYQTSHHLAEIYSGKDPQQSLKYLKEAYVFAQKLKEPYYIADITYEIGNYYLLRKDFNEALNYMEKALEVARESLSKEDVSRITSKTDYIKKCRKG
ncbi:tetratricopeptide repeat protein, partial [bacterium]|nr:tetratricopeptide repeat protein [bacterium]